MTGDHQPSENITSESIKIILEAGETFYREAEPGRIADLVIHSIFRSVCADGAAIIVLDANRSKASVYKKLGKLSFDPASMTIDRLLCIMDLSPRIVHPVSDAIKAPGQLSVCALVHPVRRHGEEYIFWAERAAWHVPFQAEELDLFTILVRQGILAMENARLRQGVSHVEESSHQKGKHGISLGNETWFDPERRVIASGQRHINLTPAEATLIAVLYHNNQQVLTHEDLVGLIQGYRTEKEDAARILRPLVCRLRKKVEQVTENPDWIQNIRGTGYRIDARCFK